MNSTFRVKLTPKASRNEISGWAQDEDGACFLKVSVTAIPEKGKANKALIALLSKSWKLPKTAFEIVGGETMRLKTMRVSGEFVAKIPVPLYKKDPGKGSC